MKKRKANKWIYICLGLFLLAMAVMTIVSRAINESRVPEVETRPPRSGFLQLDALGRGAVLFGTVSDERFQGGLFEEDTYYVEGFFYEKDYVENVSVGSSVALLIEGRKAKGVLAAEMYNYREDTIDVVILLDEGESYTVGAAVEFVLEDARVRFSCYIPKDVIYEDGDGGFYVYLLQERESILGNITIAVKTPVHIVAQNEMSAAISEELGTDAKIIRKGAELEDGMRVREKEW